MTEQTERERLEALWLATQGPEPPSDYDGRAWTRGEPDFNPEWSKYINRRVRTKAQKTAVSQHIAGKTQPISAKYLGSAVKARLTRARTGER